MTELLDAGLAFHDAGYAVLPTRADGTKAPGVPTWRMYQKDRPTRSQVERWLTSGAYHGFGLVTGAVSGQLEMLELEGRAVDAGLGNQLADLVHDAGLGDLWKRVTGGYLEHTPSGGVHLLYRVTGGDAKGNLKLASRPATDDELAANPKANVKVLIETRGEGGYVVVAPSNGTTHPSGRPWALKAGSPTTIATITAAERDALHDLCRAFDQTPEVAPEPEHTPRTRRDTDRLTPGDDYNTRARWTDILEPHGWARVHQRGHTTYWRRPDKTVGISATTGRNDGDNLYVFSTSTEFDAEKPYSKFAAYATLEHGGDFRAAARALAQKGYGEQRPATTPREHAAAEAAGRNGTADATAARTDAHWVDELAPIDDGDAPDDPPDPDVWPEPTPLGPPSPRPLPLDACGPILGPAAAAVARSLQAPADIAITFGLSIIATAAQGARRVRITPDWTEVLSLSSTSVAASGERKSPILSLLSEPLAEVEAELREQAAPDVEWRDEERQLAEARVTNARKAAIKTGSFESEAELRDAKRRLTQLEPLHMPRLLADDATPEALINLLAQQDGTIGVLSSEPGFFATITGRYSNGIANLDGALKGTSGERIRVDRIGRDPVIIESPCLTVAVCIQPGLLDTLGKKPELRYAGFLARFLYAFPEPMVGRRSIEPPDSGDSVNTGVRETPGTASNSGDSVPGYTYKEALETTTTYSNNSATDSSGDPVGTWAQALKDLARNSYASRRLTQSPELRLSHDAEQAFTNYRAWIEPHLHPQTGDLASIADWGAKLAGTTARIAAALTLIEDPQAAQITGDTMRNAIRLGTAYVAHATRVLDSIRGYGDGYTQARDVLDVILRNRWDTFTQRDVHRLLRNTNWVRDARKGPEAIAEELETLVEFGYIRSLPDEHTGPGRKPSPRFEVNPAVRKDGGR